MQSQSGAAPMSQPMLMQHIQLLPEAKWYLVGIQKNKTMIVWKNSEPEENTTVIVQQAISHVVMTSWCNIPMQGWGENLVSPIVTERAEFYRYQESAYQKNWITLHHNKW